MSDRKTKAALGKKYIEDLVHMNTTRLTYLKWAMDNIDPRQRTTQEEKIRVEVTAILKARATDYKKLIAEQLDTKRKRPIRK